MARIKKEKEKNNTILLVLIGIMFFGTIAGGVLFQSPRQEDRPLLTTPPPLTIAPLEQTVTIRHNPVNTIITTPEGRFQTVTYDDDSIFIDSNFPLVNKTLNFDVQVTNITRANFTGDPETMAIEDGDIVQVNYTGRLLSGEVFDTSIPEIAVNESVPKVSWFSVRPFYQPLDFTVGAGMMIQGFDEGVLGMKINESMTLEIPPEKGYGLHNPSLIEAIPITEVRQKTDQIKRRWDFTTIEDFKSRFGDLNITQGATFNVSGTDFGASIIYASGNVTIVEMLPKVGDVIRIYSYPWNSTVTSLTGYMNLEHDIESGDVIQFPGLPWNSTVL